MDVVTLATAALALLVFLLLLGGTAKLATAGTDSEPGGLSRLGPGVLVPERWRKPVMIFCSFGEAVLAAGLVFTSNPLPRWGTIAFFSVATYVLWELRRRRPDVGCGCFGEASSAPVGLRSIGRAVVLAGLGVVVAIVPVSGADLLSEFSWELVAAVAVGAAVLMVLSPELEEGIARVRYRAPCEQRPVSTSRILSRLRSSAEWRSHNELLTAAEPEDTWRELCWRFFVYSGRTASGARAEVVFAVYLIGRRPAVRVAVVETETAGDPLVKSIGLSATG
ncbi:MauE/DoxX family redox-associated membrane protein [Sphaerisporangium corydalis]|uniref:MauE/DoxX family redox-associated membrane protein n=1 Tax=Sphaerisporangium corydalis TaxID=1441875 RepID=A0ABV9EHS5_9ACTN|nr:MauE/DoxX family redox-associated membrane protein [Sphaerisporangium corydalis]